jgi:hypothetical protein
MNVIGKVAIAASAILWISAAVAQDTETTTTTTTSAPPPPGAYVGVPGVVGVQVGPGDTGGCEHRSKTVTNEDTGETIHKSETRC